MPTETETNIETNIKPEAWRCSHAKKLLEKDIIDGKLDGMGAEAVYHFRPEYQKYVFTNFETNLTNLRAKLEGLSELADEDGAALAHDLALNLRVNRKPYPRWQGTEAERLLKQDLDIGRHLDMYPRVLQATRPEYAPFPGKVFRDHIHQELRARKERPYWMARRKEKEEKKRQEAEEKYQKALEREARKKEKEDAKQKKKEAAEKRKKEREEKKRQKAASSEPK